MSVAKRDSSAFQIGTSDKGKRKREKKKEREKGRERGDVLPESQQGPPRVPKSQRWLAKAT